MSTDEQVWKSEDLTDKQWDLIQKEWITAVTAYQLIEEIYGSKENVELINAIDGGFFGRVQRYVTSSLIMSLSRLTDDQRRGRVTLTLLGTDDSKQKRMLGKAKAAVQGIRQVRNHRIGHMHPERSAAVPRKDFKTALNAVHAAIDHYSQRSERTNRSAVANPLGLHSGWRYDSSYLVTRPYALIPILREIYECLDFVAARWGKDESWSNCRRIAGENASQDDVMGVHKLLFLASELRGKIEGTAHPHDVE